MTASFLQILIFLLAGVAAIILLTAKYRVHAFFALFIACFITGLGVGMPLNAIIGTMKDGFGNIMKSLGFIIVLGTTLGVILEHTGSTRRMADFILARTGEKYAALAMSITGFIVGLPVFCDSGYVVLHGLNRPLAKRTGIPVIIISVSLATGLYAVHCLIPPHPGAAAAAAGLGVDFGRLIVIGIITALPAMMVGHWWAVRAGKKIARDMPSEENVPEAASTGYPSALKAFLPVLVPVLLIAVRSFFTIDPVVAGKWTQFILSPGDPVIALAIGVLLAFATRKKWNKSATARLLQESVEKAGSILVIIGAGGAFGAILAATKPAEHFSALVNLNHSGIFFCFLLAFILKTAQGSSTVAIITAASVVQPLLHALALDTDPGRLLAVLSMGAGSMAISHANDAYFWVIVKFSGLDMKTVLRTYTVATLFMSLVTLFTIYILSLVLL